MPGFYLYVVVRTAKFVVTDCSMMVFRSPLSKEWDDENVLEMGSGDDCITVRMLSMPLNCRHKNGKFHVIHLLPQLKKTMNNRS